MATSAAAIRDAIALRLTNMMFGQEPRFKKVQVDPQPQMQPDNYPGAAVFIAREVMAPEGDGNAGPIRFIADAWIAIKIVRGKGKAEDNSALIDDDADAIFSLLFTDEDFTTLDPSAALFESIEHVERQRLMPQDGDSYVAALLLTIQFRYRLVYQVVLDHDLERIDVVARPLTNPDAPVVEKRITIPQN